MPPPLLQVLQVACGGMHTVALTEGGQVLSWGVNDEGALGRETGAPPCAPMPVLWGGKTACAALPDELVLQQEQW